MKSLIILVVLFASFSSVHAQENEELFSKKRRVLVEMGYNLQNGFSTGLSSNIEDGPNTTSIGIDMGAFLTENFALKASWSFLYVGGIQFSNLAGGAKYYIAGKVPVEQMFGFNSFDNEPDIKTVYSTSSVGYAFPLADNIYLEPTLGLLYRFSDEQIRDSRYDTIVEISFSLFL